MALEDIFKALEEQADKECEQILTDARDQAEAILADATDQAERTQSEYLEGTDRAVRSKTSQQVNSARLESKKRVAAVKERAIGQVFDEAVKALEALRHTDAYSDLLQTLLQEAVSGVDGEYSILVDQADVAAATEAAKSLGLSAEVKGDITTIGGVVVSFGDGRISRRNTFEDRLDKARQFIQADVAELMFS